MQTKSNHKIAKGNEDYDPLIEFEEILGFKHYGYGKIWIPCDVASYLKQFSGKQKKLETDKIKTNQIRLQKSVTEAYERHEADRILLFKHSKFEEEQIWSTITFEREDFVEYDSMCKQKTCGVQISYQQPRYCV